jgi:starvation-inducible DNA-binding protein
MPNPYINDLVARTETAAALGRLLADSYILYLKTQGFHWNVVGPQFEPLHAMFQEQYTELAQAIDDIGERIRALGVKAPGSFSQFVTLSSISEETGSPAAHAMLSQLLSDHSTA